MAEDTEKVHPLVSNLLLQEFVPRVPDDVFRYDRDEMMRLKTVPLSVTRPDILSTDFDGDDGKFSPFKWLEYRWEVEGIKNRPANKKLQDALRADCDENAGLSPQRRGFSSGCRAPPDEKKEKDVHPLSVKEEGWNTIDNTKALFAAASSKWRAASTSSMEKFSSTKGNDFKLPFQKATAVAVDKTGRPTTWKTVEGKERQNGSFSATGKFIPARSYRGCDERGEKLPEWADDPTTIDDMIELKGFEEPAKGKKKAAKMTEPKPKASTSGRSQSGSRPSSRNQASEFDAYGNNVDMPMALPDSDAELAAILGLSNFPSVSTKNVSSTAPQLSSQAGSGLVGSRMSKFFSRNPAGSEDVAKENMNEPQSVAGEIASNPTLSKLFSHSSTGSVSPQNASRNLRPMRLEDLERTYMPQMTDNGGSDVSKFFNQSKMSGGDVGKGGSVLQDPHSQAQLLQKLNRVARQQEEGAESPPLQRLATSGLPQGYPLPGVMPQIPPEHILAAQAQHLLNIQLQQAYPGGVPQLQPQQLERMHKEMMRTLLARHQQIQAYMANASIQQAQQAKLQAPRPAMIPASVQRHMNRSAVPPQMGEKPEKEREDEMRQAELLKKQQMQQQYNALMSAMQNGLSMTAVRPGSVAPVAAAGQPTPSAPQMQALMAQAQAQHMQRIAYMQKHQQQQALLKLMAYQQQQLQQQQPQQNGEGDRSHCPAANNGNSDPLVGSIQTPLEKLLTAAGVQPSQFTGSTDSSRTNGAQGFPPSARPMSLEEIERNIQNRAASIPPPAAARPMSLQELERQLTENQSNVA